MPVTRDPFGVLPDGRSVELYTLRHGELELRATTFGAIITSLRVPDRNGRAADVVLGYESLDGYLQNRPYLGAVVGRVANRIAGGRFALDGVDWQLSRNEGENHLHGGLVGFDRRLWTASAHTASDGVTVAFWRVSPSGEEGYPGTVSATVTYRLEGRATIVIEYEAITDAPTVLNLTQHTYFDLSAGAAGSIRDHTLQIAAERFLPVDAALLPLGHREPVAATPFDFREPAALRARLDLPDEQLRRAGGFDHTYVLSAAENASGAEGPAPAAVLHDPLTGRTLRVSTTEPGLQLYTGQQLDGSTRGASGRRLDPFAGLCLETQHFPDTPNRPQFPPVTLRPAELFLSTTVWHFSAE
ncbi:MAG: aldose epimerase family protein [Vicinamibacterales bacterium]